MAATDIQDCPHYLQFIEVQAFHWDLLWLVWKGCPSPTVGLAQSSGCHVIFTSIVWAVDCVAIDWMRIPAPTWLSVVPPQQWLRFASVQMVRDKSLRPLLQAAALLWNLMVVQ